ncbi:hypothetical protein [Lebetimonas sp. JS032]|nr:hypothetical protein [Lebetimonas sp. JS032]
MDLPKSKGDFVVNEYTFEIGGKNKTKKQIKNLEYAYIVGLFGFLY